MTLASLVMGDVRAKAEWNYERTDWKALMRTLATDGTAAMVLYRLMQWSVDRRLLLGHGGRRRGHSHGHAPNGQGHVLAVLAVERRFVGPGHASVLGRRIACAQPLPTSP